MNPQNRVEKQIQQRLQCSMDSALDERIRSDMVAADKQYKDRQPEITDYAIRSIIVSKHRTNIAAALLITTGLVVSVCMYGSLGSSVAWADVTEFVESMNSFSYKTVQTVGDQSQYESVTYYSDSHGKRVDVYQDNNITAQTYVLAKTASCVVLMPAFKKCQRSQLTEAELQDELLESDPRELVRQFLSKPYETLKQKSLDGVKVEGIEIKNPEMFSDVFQNTICRLWVGAEDNLPVRIEIEGTTVQTGQEVRIVMDRIQWDIDIDSQHFEPTIPDTFVVIDG